MNSLTPEEKVIAKDNFYAAVGSPLTRRSESANKSARSSTA